MVPTQIGKPEKWEGISNFERLEKSGKVTQNTGNVFQANVRSMYYF